MKKKITLMLLMVALCGIAFAQHHRPGRPGPQTPAPQGSISFQSQNGEMFVVYIDGDLYNRGPQAMVVMHNIPFGRHEINVVLKQPADKIVTLYLDVSAATPRHFVSYNARDGRLTVFADNATYGGYSTPSYPPMGNIQPEIPPQVPVMVPNIPVRTDAEVDQIIQNLRNEPFDDSRLALSEAAAGNMLYTAQQISRMVDAFSFDSNKLTFLKSYYRRCADPENFYICIQQLNLKSNRDELTAFINAR